LDTEVEEHELLRIVRTAISELSPELKEVLALAYFKGQSHSEIAETLQQPLGTVKTRIRSAMQQLRVRLRHVV
jgi:RNA polymerase sigma-70 factor (ECF subfamily)